MIRRIIHIDEAKCNGCGLCADACHEGAIGMVDGKARLLREDYCDGLGDCLPSCPAGAITFEEREAPAYDHGSGGPGGKAPGRFIPRSAAPRRMSRFPGGGVFPADVHRRSNGFPGSRNGPGYPAVRSLSPFRPPQPAHPVAGADQAGPCDSSVF